MGNQRTTAATSFDGVFVRHCLAAKHGDFERLTSLFRAGFECNSSSSGSLSSLRFTRVSRRWTVAIESKHSSWVYLTSNVVASEDLYEANCKSRRMEVVWVCYDGRNGQWNLRWTSARKPLVEFGWETAAAANASGLKCNVPEFEAELNGLEGEDLFWKIFQNLGLPLSTPTVSVVGEKYDIRTAEHQPLAESCQIQVFSGSGLARNESEVSARLRVAIGKGDADAVRLAIQEGASLEHLPETSVSPLRLALLNCGNVPNWRVCAQQLVDAGCEFPKPDVVVEACGHLVAEENSIEILKFLIDNGVDLNLTPEGEFPALYSAATRKRLDLIKFLLDHGADPLTASWQGRTIVQEIMERVEKAEKFGRRPEYASVLEVLTGTPYTLPEKHRPSEAVLREARRFHLIATAKFLRKSLPKSAELNQIVTSRLFMFENYSQWQNELLQLGFVEACHFVNQGQSGLLQSVFTHEEFRCEAIFEGHSLWTGGLLRLQMAAYVGQQIILTSNQPWLGDTAFIPEMMTLSVYENASPEKLLEKLRSKITEIEVDEIRVANAFERQLKQTQVFYDAVREQTRVVEKRKIKNSDGVVPRFERLGIYLQADPQREPDECTSANLTRAASEALQAESAPISTSGAVELVRDAAILALVDHLEFAGALNDLALIDRGIEAGVLLIRDYCGGRLNDQNGDGIWIAEPLGHWFALASARKAWAEMSTVCELLEPTAWDVSFHDYCHDPVEIAFAQMMFVNQFRASPIESDNLLRARIDESKCQRAKHLADATEAIAERDPDKFKSAIEESLKQFTKRKPRSDWSFDIDRLAPWYETALWHLAIERELAPPPLKARQNDRIVRCGG